MKKILLAVVLCAFMLPSASPSEPPPVVGLCLAAPGPDGVKDFISFMEKDLAPGGVNTVVLRVDYRYAYETYPNLRYGDPLTLKQVKKIVKKARALNIRLIPEIDLLGHQSWETHMGILLREYPQFDENPSVKLPDKYHWPNDDGLYCKSYCPLHPDLHKVLFAVIDELMEAFEADAFHAGMDEVFYIGEEECPRCTGRDRSELFAGEVNLIRDHLAEKGRELWIWGDRLLEGKTSGLGIWEASGNDTHRAIDLVNKDVVICDWHYERADPTAALFAMKGFRVITCPHDRPGVTLKQLEMLDSFRQSATRATRKRYYGFMQTIWNDWEDFYSDYTSFDPEISDDPDDTPLGAVASFREMIRYYNPEP